MGELRTYPYGTYFRCIVHRTYYLDRARVHTAPLFEGSCFLKIEVTIVLPKSSPSCLAVGEPCTSVIGELICSAYFADSAIVSGNGILDV